jgi:quinol monooxygenase YgiN
VILIVARHRVRPEFADDFAGLVTDFTAGSRAEPGCITFEWARSTDDPAVYYLVEAFRDAAAGEAHVSSGHFTRAIAQMPGLLSEPPEIIHTDVPGGWSRMAELSDPSE